MLVELITNNLIKETEDTLNCNVKLTTSNSVLNNIHSKFTGYLGVNKDMMRVLSILPYISYYKLIYEKDEAMSQIVRIPNIKNTDFIFSFLRTLGITLNYLELELMITSGGFKLYVHPKIMKALEYTPANELINYLLSIFKVVGIANSTKFKDEIFPQSSEYDVVTNPLVLKNEDSYSKICNIFNNEPEKRMIEVVPLSTSTEMAPLKCVNYGRFNRIKGGPINISINCEQGDYKYNLLYNSNTNKSFLNIIFTKSKESYIIDIEGKCIYTNGDLQKFNTVPNTEFITYLTYVCDILNVEHVNNVLEKIAHQGDEITISSDGEIIENSPLVSNLKLEENLDYNIYKTLNIINGKEFVKINNNQSFTNLHDQYINDNFAQTLYLQCQKYYETFDLKDLNKTVTGIAKGDIYSMLFIGEAGTGKSTAARVIPYRCGLPFIVVNCSTNIEESDLFGSMIANPYKHSADDPEFIWQDGILTKAIRNGYCAIIEEINFARPGILGKLNSLLDESRQIDLQTGEIIKAHPNFRIIATCNIGYEGTNRLNKAFINRFESCKIFNDLNRKEACDVIVNRTGYKDIAKVNKVYDIYEAIKKYSTEQNLGLVVSIRQLLDLFKQYKYYQNTKEAILNTLINKTFLEEPEHLIFFTDTVLESFDLNFKL